MSQGADAFLLCPSNNRHAHAVHSVSFISSSKAASTGRKRTKQREKRMKDRDTKVPTLSFIGAAESPWQTEQNEIACADLIISAVLF